MKLSSKQIAALLHVEPKSVRMAKYRLKQKLGLGKDDELDAVIQNLTA
jgi:DNA-binding CsgD family transcriptional regulator